MKILILAEDYTKPNNLVSLHYIHSRNVLYLENGIDVSVLSFRTDYDYEIDGIKVYKYETYEKKLKEIKYDVLVCHAPNLKNHLRFLIKYSNSFNNIVFFFHGHEVLKTSKVYPKPYSYIKTQTLLWHFRKNIYDSIKLMVWRHYFKRIVYKSQFVFVSKWMYDMFIKFIEIDPKIINDRKHIIYNCVGKEFEINNYNPEAKKEYDFITIRNNLDGSKYGIDIVTKIAKNNPKYKFCIVGKGKFFQFNEKPDNVEWIDKNLNHKEIIELLNKSKCALLPTRADSQGVMACEIATFGMPLITSNIDVCKEIFEGFENVAFIDNNDENIDIEPIFKKLQNIKMKEKNEKYFEKNTVSKEIELFRKLKR